MAETGFKEDREKAGGRGEKLPPRNNALIRLDGV